MVDTELDYSTELVTRGCCIGMVVGGATMGGLPPVLRAFFQSVVAGQFFQWLFTSLIPNMSNWCCCIYWRIDSSLENLTCMPSLPVLMFPSHKIFSYLKAKRLPNGAPTSLLCSEHAGAISEISESGGWRDFVDCNAC